MSNKILVVDDELDFLQSVRRGLLMAGFRNIQLENKPEKAASRIEKGETFDIALIDITMPGINGIELLEKIKSRNPATECIMITALDEARAAVECLKRGAYDYLVKPISPEALLLSLKHALERKRLLDILDLRKKTTPPKLNNEEAFRPIVTASDRVLKILKEAELHAASNVPVLITGESGTGKELLARAIHLASPRKDFTFTAVNMASLTNNLFDAEFFGHAKGSFTGAEKDRAGYLEHTNRGTLFLDEIGILPFELQGKLLRVLQDGEYIKLGTSRPMKADLRFITATNADLNQLMARGKFRKDLYYRLRGAWLHLPPLRERKEDIPLLIERFLLDLRKDSKAYRIEEKAMSVLLNYDYPGNIRELKAMLQTAINVTQGKVVFVSNLPAFLRKQAPATDIKFKSEPGSILPLAEVEKKHILKIYHSTGSNKSKTARLLHIGINTLRRKLASYGAN